MAQNKDTSKMTRTQVLHKLHKTTWVQEISAVIFVLPVMALMMQQKAKFLMHGLLCCATAMEMERLFGRAAMWHIWQAFSCYSVNQTFCEVQLSRSFCACGSPGWKTNNNLLRISVMLPCSKHCSTELPGLLCATYTCHTSMQHI